MRLLIIYIIYYRMDYDTIKGTEPDTLNNIVIPYQPIDIDFISAWLHMPP